MLSPRTYYKPGLQEIWKRAVPATVGGVTVLALCHEDLLLHLCAHIAYHHITQRGLRSLYDIKMVLARFGTQVDWAALSGRAQDWGIASSVYLALCLVDVLLGCDLPPQSMQSMRPAGFDEGLILAAKGRIFGNLSLSPELTSVWRTWRARAWRRIALPPDVLVAKYKLPPRYRWVYLYYFVRFKDLLFRFGRDLFGLLSDDSQKSAIVVSDNILIDYLGWQAEE